MSLDAFRKCEVPGCAVDVYCPVDLITRCLAHGGPGYPEFGEPDEWGTPQEAERPEPLPPVAPADLSRSR